MIFREKTKSVKSEDFIRLMRASEVRGTDAFGFYSLKTNKITKAKGTISEFMQFFSEGQNYLLNEVRDSKVLLGHTRNKTMGNESFMKNNHPFETKDFILAHNGVIFNSEEMLAEEGIKTDIETDSYSLVALIQKEYDEHQEVIEAIRKTVEKTSGFSCWLYDKGHKIYFFRDRYPLVFFFGRKHFSFASSEEILKSIYQRSKVDFSETEEGMIYEFDFREWRLRKMQKFTPKNKLYSWNWNAPYELEYFSNLDEEDNVIELFWEWAINNCPPSLHIYYDENDGADNEIIFQTDDKRIRDAFAKRGFTFSKLGTLHLRGVERIKDFLRLCGEAV